MCAAEQRMELLLEVSGALAAAATRDAVARIVTSTGIAALDAAYGGLWLLDDERRSLRLVAVSTLPRGTAERWATLPLDGDTPLAEAVRAGEPIFIDSLAAYQARFPSSYERIQETISSPDASYALVPLVEGGPPLGALAITYERAHALGASERTFLRILARQCALALQRIALLDAERAARVAAEEAIRAREELLSVVSHDLRSPLSTMLIGASTLQQLVAPEDRNADRILAIAGRIHRQSERMTRLIDDLVDFAGIQAGKLTIERQPTHPTRIVSATAELHTPIAQERSVRLTVEIPDDLPLLVVDPDRAVQALSNLLGNALKVTSKGREVAIGVLGGGPEVVFFVRDTGPGIATDELPLLFERHWRSKQVSYKGAGLGLSIARGIVEAHGGRIWAESQIGAGSTFFFTLMPRP